MIGSFGGEGGEFFSEFGRMEDHLNRSMKMKAKMVKTKGCNNKDVTFAPTNCRKCDIFFSLFVSKYMFKLLDSFLMFLIFHT